MIRNSNIAQPRWVSAPAVLYDGNSLAYLVFAVQLPNQDGPGRYAWRSTLITIQIDYTGPYSDPVDALTLNGVRFNAAPIVMRNAWGYNNHVLAVGGSDGRLLILPSWGYTRGAAFSHNLVPLLPPPNNPAYPGATNANAGISGNYMAASRGGSIAFVGAHSTQSRPPSATASHSPYSIPDPALIATRAPLPRSISTDHAQRGC